MTTLRGAPAMLALTAMAVIIAVAGIVIGEIRKPKGRPVPGLPDDGDPLACWEWDRWDLIEEHYASDAAEPARRVNPLVRLWHKVTAGPGPDSRLEKLLRATAAEDEAAEERGER